MIFASGVANALASVDATAVARRDLADGVVKPQLVVPLPSQGLRQQDRLRDRGELVVPLRIAHLDPDRPAILCMTARA